MNRTANCLIQPILFNYNGSIFEYSVYKPTPRFLRDFDSIFPHLSTKQKKQLLVIVVIQKCEHDMVGVSKEVNDERDIKLELVTKIEIIEGHIVTHLLKFVDWGQHIVKRIRSIGMWADIMDPASGFPVNEMYL